MREAQCCGQVRKFANLINSLGRNSVAALSRPNYLNPLCSFYSTGATTYSDLPTKLRKSDRKPWVTHITKLKHKARLQRKERESAREQFLRPPENGLLVKDLIPVARQVYSARAQLLSCVTRVMDCVPVYSCSVCGEVHVGDTPHKIKTCNFAGSQASKEHMWERGNHVECVMPVVESFHIYDRLGRAVSHNDRLQVDRIPAIVELCVQAGIDIPEYPTRRRAFPAYSVAGRILDFEKRFPKEDQPGKEINTFGFWERRKHSREVNHLDSHSSDDVQDAAIKGMEEWEKMRSGTLKLMQKYGVVTCGYCAEVQVGPKGHRVRNCQAYKHQMRDGQHAWQEATVDDIINPVYVWHVRDVHSGLPLINELKKYYGMLPAVVELFAQAGAIVGCDYVSVMREDVAVPELSEEKLVV